jgi:TIGR03009 family protein
MQKVQTLVANLGRVDKDTTFNNTQKFVGFAQYMRVGTGPTAQNLALMEMKFEGRNEVAERFVCTGTYLYQYVVRDKEIRAYELPKPKEGQVADDNFLSFLFGMKAVEARRRYDLKLANEDQHYVYVDILPRTQFDMSDFKRARIVLNKDSFLPRQLWFESANGSEITWDIPAIKSGLQIARTNFDAPKPPQGWKLVPVPRGADGPPRTTTIRGQGPTAP